jgi:hypothetical protein
MQVCASEGLFILRRRVVQLGPWRHSEACELAICSTLPMAADVWPSLASSRCKASRRLRSSLLNAPLSSMSCQMVPARVYMFDDVALDDLASVCGVTLSMSAHATPEVRRNWWYTSRALSGRTRVGAVHCVRVQTHDFGPLTNLGGATAACYSARKSTERHGGVPHKSREKPLFCLLLNSCRFGTELRSICCVESIAVSLKWNRSDSTPMPKLCPDQARPHLWLARENGCLQLSPARATTHS